VTPAREARAARSTRVASDVMAMILANVRTARSSAKATSRGRSPPWRVASSASGSWWPTTGAARRELRRRGAGLHRARALRDARPCPRGEYVFEDALDDDGFGHGRCGSGPPCA